MQTKIHKIQSEILKGNVVIMPTETIYGLLVLKRFEQKLYELKQRPAEIVFANIFSSIEDALFQIDEDPLVEKMLRSILPGPFTVITKSKSGEKIGIRIPDHELFLKVIKPIKEDLVMTSVNLHGKSPAISFEEAISIFPKLPSLDGGKPKYSRPSVILEIKR